MWHRIGQELYWQKPSQFRGWLLRLFWSGHSFYLCRPEWVCRAITPDVKPLFPSKG